MREFAGVKPSLAQDLTGFTGTAKMFRDRYRDAESSQHQRYRAHRIRQIRMDLAGIPEAPRNPHSLPPIINARMTKGGVGKTTLVGNIAAALAMMGYKVLMIDGDPQAGLTVLFGVNWKETALTHIADLMKRVSLGLPTKASEAVFPMYEGGMLDLIATDIGMANDMWLMSALNREHLFTRLLECEKAFFSQYDVILIDSAPGSSLLATTFMLGSKTLLAPVEPEGQAIAALDVLDSNVAEINEAFGRQGINIDVHILINKYNHGKKPHGIAAGYLAAKYPGLVNDTLIRDSVGFLRETELENIAKNGPIIEKEPNSTGARDIIDVARSLVKLYDIKMNGYDLLTREAA